MKRFTLLWLVSIALPLGAHDFWLVPAAFHLAPGTELVIHGQTSSTFPTSLSAVTPDRVASAQIIDVTGSEPIRRIDVDGRSLRLRHRPERVGQLLIAVQLLPRLVNESPESFREYLRLEGAPEALARYDSLGLLPTDSIIRRYAKYATTLVQVGGGGPRVFDRIAGHPFEFVALDDPSTAQAGDTIRIRMLYAGRPLPHARGHVGVAPSSDATASAHDAPFVTDADGEFRVPITANGLWNVRALHIVPAPRGSGADWDVHWATLVWFSGAS